MSWWGTCALLVGVAVLTGTTALVASLALDVRLRDPEGFLGPSYVRLPALAAGFLLVDLLPRLALGVRSAGGGARAAAARAVLRERLAPQRLGLVLLGLLSFYVTYVGYRNLKNHLPLLRGELHDRDLLRLDEAMAFGADPAHVLHEALGTGVAAHVLSAVYVFFLFFVPFSLALALVRVRDPRDGYWYVTALGLNWALGTASYYLLPALGPVYADPAQYADLPATGVSELQASLMRSRVLVLADPHGTDRIHGIAAFASLHVSIVLTAALVAQLAHLGAVVRWVLWAYAALTALATVYFGWHYLVDVLAGAAVAGASVWLGALGTRAWRHRAVPLPPGPPVR
ncbi:phosphatase PAP2 family protein [Kineococcus indalonis]|uniref:phosphatase PAP2 family protein n=1 Tax=Kineococcus indalonis TaxID=2696566 RepID=UPI0014135991|nr:phosphatase PAP2 family protein [Kineococcus indalonis]NAZ87445.1 phosphatase PAP2 family protein [Kineococcus indalonis]